QQQSMADKYGVSFAKAGEKVTYTMDNGPRTIEARAPRLNELHALDLALLKSQPGQLSLDGKTGVKFNFIPDSEIDGGNFNAGGLYEKNGGRPNIFLQNELLQSKPMTERDRDLFPNQEDGSRRQSLEGTATHEIAHNSDHKVRESDHPFEEQVRNNM